MIINGTYLDGKTSRRVKARLDVLQRHSLDLYVLHEDQDRVKIPLDYSDLKIESRIGNTPREISFGDNQLFITDDHDGINEFITLHSTSLWTEVIHKLETNLALVLTSTVITLSLIWLAFSSGIPKSAEYIAFQLPNFTSEHFGSTLSVLDEAVFDPSQLSDERQLELQTLAKPFLQDDPSLNATLVFRSSDSANAFALPDGHIVFTDDIVHLAKNDQELLAILFHELGHLKYKHLLRRALQDSMITLTLILITGDLDTIDLITGLPTLMLDLHYSKEFEREADYFAIQKLHEYQMPVDAFANIMKGLEENQLSAIDLDESEGGIDKDQLIKLSEFLSTHPATQARIDMVENFKKGITSK